MEHSTGRRLHEGCSDADPEAGPARTGNPRRNPRRLDAAHERRLATAGDRPPPSLGDAVPASSRGIRRAAGGVRHGRHARRRRRARPRCRHDRTDVVSPGPSAPRPDDPSRAAPEAGTPDVVDSHADPDAAVGSDQVDGISVIANGDGVVIANDGAIISVGDNTVVHGNTGDATSSGTIGIDVNDSDLTTGNSGVASGAQHVNGPAPPTTPRPRKPRILKTGSSRMHGGAPPATRSARMRRPRARLRLRATTALHRGRRQRQPSRLRRFQSVLPPHRHAEREHGRHRHQRTERRRRDPFDRSVGELLGFGTCAGQPPPIRRDQLRPNGTSASVPTATASRPRRVTTRSSSVATASRPRRQRVRRSQRGHLRRWQAAVGGTGDVNSQIGDSANGGTVVMKVVDSNIVAGDALAGSAPPLA